MNKCMLIIFILLAACASHKYRVEGNDLIFTLDKPNAKKVVLFSSHDGFQPRTAMNRSGRWEVRLPANEGFRYFYIIDGVPYIPDCSMKEIDDFGSENCIFEPHL